LTGRSIDGFWAYPAHAIRFVKITAVDKTFDFILGILSRGIASPEPGIAM
jgi:hypothetical protein